MPSLLGVSVIVLFACGPAAAQLNRQPKPGQAPKSVLSPAGGSQLQAVAPADLPADFRPPREVPPVMNITKELITAGEIKAFKKDLIKYQKALRQGNLDNRVRDLIDRGVRFRLYQMTLKENRRLIHKRRDEMVRDVNFAGKVPGAKQDARLYLLAQITKRAEELLDNNFQVRLNTVILLSMLDEVDADNKRKIARKAYTPAAEVLLKVLVDPDQLEAIKLRAVAGLQRIASIGDPNNQLRLKMAKTVDAELKKTNLNAWYQWQLVEALASMGLISDLRPRPFVVQTLAELVVDQKRHWVVRSAAAKALGRIPLNAGINMDLLAFAIVDLSLQSAQAYNTSPGDIFWKRCFWYQYLGFHHENAAEKSSKMGLLLKSSNRPKVKAAYDQVVSLVKHVINEPTPKPLTKEQLQPVADWLKNNQPDNYKVAPTEQPIITSANGQAKPAANTGATTGKAVAGATPSGS